MAENTLINEKNTEEIEVKVKKRAKKIEEGSVSSLLVSGLHTHISDTDRKHGLPSLPLLLCWYECHSAYRQLPVCSEEWHSHILPSE